MNSEDLFNAFAEIDESYLMESKRINTRNATGVMMKRISTMVAAFVLIIGGIVIGQKIHMGSIISMKVLATEIGKEYMQFGATVPRIINVTEHQVIMYDYVGVWVYDLEQQELAGFCDFRPLNMTQIQGSPCTLVEATRDGKYVKFYRTDGTLRYLYDVAQDSYRQVQQYDKELDIVSSLNVSESKSLSECAETYVINDGYYISYGLDLQGDPSELRYKDLVIITEKDGVIQEYRPFGNK